MHVYDCKVRLAGSLSNEVQKPGVTAPEILLLREIHGHDAVVDIQPRRVDSRTNEAEHDRLRAEYSAPLVERMFGPSFKELPRKLPDRDLPEAVEDDQIAKVGRVKRRASRSEAAPPEPPAEQDDPDLLN